MVRYVTVVNTTGSSSLEHSGVKEMDFVDIASHSFVLPDGYTWNPTLVNGKKEGVVEVRDDLGTVYAILSYKNDKLNGFVNSR